jgi:copper chaperone CopZ
MSTKTAIISVDELKPDNLLALRQALEAVPGVSRVDFNLERSVAVLEFDPSQSHIDDFLRAVLKAGFKVL